MALLLAWSGTASLFSLGVPEQQPKLTGTVIPLSKPAPDFMLTDQRGLSFHLADTRGKVVVLTFIYTHCSDVCPFIAMKLKSAHDQLGNGAVQTAFVAVTTDPERDTQGVIEAYSRAVGLSDEWHFVTGPLSALKRVWSNYGVGVEAHPGSLGGQSARLAAKLDEEPSQGLSAPAIMQARTIAGQFGGGYEVSHSSPIWIIDKGGLIRTLMDADALPTEIAANVRALMGR